MNECRANERQRMVKYLNHLIQRNKKKEEKKEEKYNKLSSE